MYIQILIEGSIKRLWYADDFPTVPFTLETHKARKAYFDNLIIQCMADAGEMIYGRLEYALCIAIASKPTDTKCFYCDKLDALYPG